METFMWLFVIIFGLEIALFWWVMHKALNRLEASDQDRADAQRWRHGQKPVGKLIKVDDVEGGLQITGTITDPDLAKFIQGPPGSYSIDGYVKGERVEPPTYDVLPLQGQIDKYVLSKKFKFDREDLIGLDPDTIKAKIDKEITDFKTRVWNDGWIIDENEGMSTFEEYDIDYDQHKYRVEFVGTPKARFGSASEPWWFINADPPKGARWKTPMECHGNRGFCSTCSPRNPDRPWVVRDA